MVEKRVVRYGAVVEDVNIDVGPVGHGGSKYNGELSIDAIDDTVVTVYDAADGATAAGREARGPRE